MTVTVTVLLYLLLGGLAVVGQASSPRVRSAGVWAALLSGCALSSLALYYGAEVVR